MENLQRPVHNHLQVDTALRAPPAQLLAINSRIHKQNAILQIYLQKVPVCFGRHPEQARHQLCQLQPQVLSNAANKGAVFGFLRDRVVELAAPHLPGCEEQKRKKQILDSQASSPRKHHCKRTTPFLCSPLTSKSCYFYLIFPIIYLFTVSVFFQAVTKWSFLLYF
ncbi:PREDICTED: uncharacterized protein LOC105599908 [Cercocebus atys]|uniref:uncharacterized protein LOC105599908 n=1 Tax=Cercocebus atys TaxID=9531 RepID=UPI0005F3C8EE|nr:PREDICTED: uncharacterized protein LOC105599908 [Cercocebus atys]